MRPSNDHLKAQEDKRRAAEVRKLTGFCQMDIDIAAEQLEAEGMLTIERTYTLVED
jgi:hypothetical protein